MGMSGREACNCRTEDDGAACEESAGCEGTCLFERWEPVPPGGPEVPDAPSCGAGETLHAGLGRCSGWTHVFGCRSRLTERSFRCAGGLALRAPYSCVD